MVKKYQSFQDTDHQATRQWCLGNENNLLNLLSEKVSRLRTVAL